VQEEDLIEELGRVHGYENIPETPIHGTTTFGGVLGFELWLDWICEGALRAGMNQAMSHSLVSPHPMDDPAVEQIRPRATGTADTLVLRNTLLTSLVDVIRNDQRDVQAFEIGRIFGKAKNPYDEIHLGLIASGPVVAKSWYLTEGVPTNYFTMKGSLESILESAGVKAEYKVPGTLDPRFHPARQAIVLAGGTPIGLIGEIHPDVAGACNLEKPTMVAEISLRKAFEARQKELALNEISNYPSTTRDISILISRSIPYEELERSAKAAAGTDLEKISLFDVFTKNVDEDKQVLGIRLRLRKQKSSFKDEEANQVRDRVVVALVDLGATMR